MKIFDRDLFIKGGALLFLLGLTASCTRSLSVDSAIPTGPSLPVATNTPTFTSSPTPTGSYTATPTNTGTNTNTPTNTSTPTATFTSTSTATNTATNTATPIIFENWEGPYTSGNMWATFASCNQATFISNPWTNNTAPITTCYDSTPGDPHTGNYCWRSEIIWSAASNQAEIAPDSAYGGDYGFPINIAASAPSSISIWLKSDTPNIQFLLYFKDTSGSGSGTPLHTATYQGGTGSNMLLTIPTANTWTNFVLPLQPANQWSTDPATMNWGSILDIGTVFQGPASGSFPITTNIYMDDYTFIK